MDGDERGNGGDMGKSVSLPFPSSREEIVAENDQPKEDAGDGGTYQRHHFSPLYSCVILA